MCIILKKPAGKKLVEETYRKCFWTHSDGCGFAYVDPEKNDLVIEKGLMNFPDAYKAISAVEDLEMLIHFRKISRGPASLENCHPFMVESYNKRFAFAIAHNGTLDIKPLEKLSDTATFVDLILGNFLKRDPYVFDSHNRRWVLEQWMGERNKIVIMRYDRKEKFTDFIHFNKDGLQTNTHDDVWFSNYSWKPYQSSNVHTPYNPSLPSYVGCSPELLKQDEHKADHLGWHWKANLQAFVLRFKDKGTETVRAELSYRKPHDIIYKYAGKNFSRYSDGFDVIPFGIHLKGNDTKAPDSTDDKNKHTIIPVQGNLPIKPDEPKGMNADEFLKKQKEDESPPADAAEASVEIEVVADDKEDEAGKDDWEKDIDRSRNIGSYTMGHLSKKEKKELRRLAMDYFGASFGDKERKGVHPDEAVVFVRHMYREEFPATRLLTIPDLDRRILANGFIEPERVDDCCANMGGMGMGGEI